MKKDRPPSKRDMIEMRERAAHPSRLKRKKTGKRVIKKSELTERKASLLPIGVLRVEGEFCRGDVVEIFPAYEREKALRLLLDAVGSTRVVLCGDVEGGQLAAYVAATHPDRVRALVLCCTSAGGAGGGDGCLFVKNHERPTQRHPGSQ